MKGGAVFRSGNFIIIARRGTIMQIPCSKILLIKKEQQQTVIVTNNDNGYGHIVCYCSLRHIHEILNDEKFIYEHRSFIFNIDHIACMHDRMILIDDGSPVFLGKNSFYRIMKYFMAARMSE